MIDRFESRHRAKPFKRPHLEALESRCLLAVAPGVYITELMAANDGRLLDRNDETSDWVEVTNYSAKEVNLNGWHLSDDARDLDLWRFPDVSLASGEQRIVFASGADGGSPSDEELHANFRLNRNGGFLALTNPDGETIQHQHHYPALNEEISYGLPMSDFLPRPTEEHEIESSTQIPIAAIDVLSFENTFGTPNSSADIELAIDGNINTSSQITPSFTRGEHIFAVDFGETQSVSRLRMAKHGDADLAGDNGAPGLAPIDNIDLQILYSEDSGPLHQRQYHPVTDLTSGYRGTETIRADAVDALMATVDNDHHDLTNDGWLSLTFDRINATSIAVRFSRDRADSAPWGHYNLAEIELRNNDAAPIPITSIEAFRPAKGGFLSNGLSDLDHVTDGNTETFSFLTPARNQQPHLAAFDLGHAKTIERIRVYKNGNTDGTNAGAPGLGSIDNMDLQFLYTTDSGNLKDRVYQPVKGLTSGFLGDELIDADSVNSANAVIDNDHHDALSDGWYALSFDAVEATGVAIRFERDDDDSANWVHYPMHELEIHAPIILAQPSIQTLDGIAQFPAPGGEVRASHDIAFAIDASLETFSTLTTEGTNRSHGRQRVAIDLGQDGQTTNRVRVFKGNIDSAFDLRILYTDDSGTLDQRQYLPVSQLTNGYNDTERMDAQFVDYATGDVLRDWHSSSQNGFYSLTFAEVQATGLAIECFPHSPSPADNNQYPIRELQAYFHDDVILSAQPLQLPTRITDDAGRIFSMPTPGATNRPGESGPTARSQADSVVVFNEVMKGSSNSDDWIELYNQMGVDVDLSGWTVEGGIFFEFPRGTIIEGGSYLVVSSDDAKPDDSIPPSDWLSPLTGNLSSTTQQLVLRNNSRRVMDTLTFTNAEPWPVAAFVSSASLAKRNPMGPSGSAQNWYHSMHQGGTPGADNFPDGIRQSLAFSELAAVTENEYWIEIANDSAAHLNLGDFFIHSTDTDRNFELPKQVLPPNQHAAVALNELGYNPEVNDRLLLYAQTGELFDARIVDNGLRGRNSHDNTGRAEWRYPTSATPGAPNRFETEDAIVINEIMYHHRPQQNPYREIDEEWIELYNNNDNVIDLGGWVLDDAVEFEFPENTLIGPRSYLVIAADATTLRSKYPDIQIAGSFIGRLSNASGHIVLRDAAGNPADVVHYFESGRWPEFADGGGSSLELRDPDADNSIAESWAASQEFEKAQWHSFRYRATAKRDTGIIRWNEFIFGMLDAGEVLIDDLRVVENPDGNAIELIQNGSFENDPLDSAADKWRIVGNHHGTVVADPNQPDNHVLHLVATGSTKDAHNHAETTFVDNHRVRNGRDYEISFRAKWLVGSNQLNARLYAHRVSETFYLPQPVFHGTPGMQNSIIKDEAVEADIGPTMDHLNHFPVVPDANEPITVSIDATDPDGVDSIDLWYRVGRADWQRTPMSPESADRFSGVIPGQSARAIVQFFVAAEDAVGQISHFPAEGMESRALFQVQDSQARDGIAHNFRIIMTQDDARSMRTDTNLLSNQRLSATVIYNEHEVFYDVGLRLKGTAFARPNATAVSYNIRFHPDNLFRGIHDNILIDRSGLGQLGRAGQDEILTKHITNAAGGIPGMYDDVVRVIGPQRSLNGYALLVMARYRDVFLDSQFEDGGDGSAFKLEVVLTLTETINGRPESPKRTVPGFVRTDIQDLGDRKEDYRWNLQVINNRAKDDFSHVIPFAKAWSLRGEELDVATQQTMDVDQWMRTFAMINLVGATDTYGQGSPHNLKLYVRPEDNRVLALPWDLDGNFNLPVTAPAWSRQGDWNNLRRIIEIPSNQRVFYGHLSDMINTVFNADYMQRWTSHYGAATRENYAGLLSYIDGRSRSLQRRLPEEVPFEITSHQGNSIQTDQRTISIQGKGWIDVDRLFIKGNPIPLDVTWLNNETWQVEVPLLRDENSLDFMAFDVHDNRVGADSIHVSTTANNPVESHLQISEIHYHPSDPSASELAMDPALTDNSFEFIEFTNIGSETINLTNIQSMEGVGFVLPNVELEIGQSAVVVQNESAFRIRYGDAPQVLGEFTFGRLSNQGERIMLVGSYGDLLFDFEYSDEAPWPTAADGEGASLELINPYLTPQDELNRPTLWRASLIPNGSPGTVKLWGDFSKDNHVDEVDIALLCEAMRSNDDDLSFDLNQDRQVGHADFELMIFDVLRSTIGDTNLDGIFDSRDFVAVFQAGEYEDSIEDNSTWVEGDWNCDGDFTTFDMVYAFQVGGYSP